MEDFATKDMSVNVQMDFTGLTVKKVIKKVSSQLSSLPQSQQNCRYCTVVSSKRMACSEDFIYFESTHVRESIW